MCVSITVSKEGKGSREGEVRGRLGEMARLLGALAALPVDLSLVSCTHLCGSQSPVAPVPRRSDTLFWPLWTPTLMCLTDTQTQTCMHAHTE